MTHSYLSLPLVALGKHLKIQMEGGREESRLTTRITIENPREYSKRRKFQNSFKLLMLWNHLARVYVQETPKAEGKCRIVDLRFGNVKVNAQSLRIHYQE